MCKHQIFISELCRLAVDVQPVGAARIAAGLVYKNEFVAFGINQLKTHPFQAKFSSNPESIHLHAEIDCIKNFTKRTQTIDISKCTLYVSRMKFTDSTRRNMIQGIACPCQAAGEPLRPLISHMYITRWTTKASAVYRGLENK